VAEEPKQGVSGRGTRPAGPLTHGPEDHDDGPLPALDDARQGPRLAVQVEGHVHVQDVREEVVLHAPPGGLPHGGEHHVAQLRRHRAHRLHKGRTEENPRTPVTPRSPPAQGAHRGKPTHTRDTALTACTRGAQGKPTHTRDTALTACTRGAQGKPTAHP